MKKVLTALLGLFLVFSLFGCGSEKTALTETSEEQSAAFDIEKLVGNWQIEGVYIDGEYYDLDSNARLNDLYDGTSLTFNDDGTFVYKQNVFFSKGVCKSLNSGMILLETGSVYRKSVKDGEIVDVEATGEKVSYIVSFVDGKENRISFLEYNPVTGGPETDGEPTIFTKTN